MASEVATESEETVAFLNAALLRSRPRAALIAIESEFGREELNTRRVLKATEDILDSHLSLTDLADLRKGLQRQDDVLRGLRDQIREESQRLDESLSEIRTRNEAWRRTEEAGRSQDYPQATIDLIGQTLTALDEAREEIAERRSHLLGLQNSIVVLRGSIHESALKVTTAEEAFRTRLFSFRAEPLWDASQLDAAQIWQRFRDQLVRSSGSFKDYALSQKHSVFLSVLALVIVTLLLRATRKRLGNDVGDEKSLRGATLALEHPFTSSVLLVVFVNSILHPEAPHSWHTFLLLVGLLALLRLLPAFVPDQFATFSLLFLGLRALELVNAEIPEVTPLGRLLTLLVVVLSTAAVVWFKSRLKTLRDTGKGWLAILRWASWTAMVVLAIAFLSGILGNLTLAGLLAGGILKAAFLGLSLWLVFHVFWGMLVLLLRSSFARKSPMLRSNQELIVRKTTRVAGVIAVLLFVVAVPNFFALFEPVAAAVVETATTPLKIRALSISPADILAFVFLVWLSFQISRLVCFILEEDTLPRLKLPRGVPAAVSKLTYYTILLVGFLIALTAAGFDVSRITLLLSAFGVGIGFGLQNVVNNFVSGLILLFERPIHIGDRIQLAQDLTGEVVRIGIRASVVRTFEGAEVLVPNGQLISNELTNWTLSDPKRRITIPVGVAYGTDPRKILDLLKSLASAHPQVLPDPAPNALFMGFGESSLDFSLRVWVANFDVSFEVRSDLSVAINEALREAGIEIPFPQRDLHLRSVAGNLSLQVDKRPADRVQDVEADGG